MAPFRAILALIVVAACPVGLLAKDGVIFVSKDDSTKVPIANEEIYWMIDPAQDIAAYQARIDEITASYEALRQQKENAVEKAHKLLAEYHARLEMHRTNVAKIVSTAAATTAVKLQRLDEEERRQRFEYPSFARDFAEWQQRNLQLVKERRATLEASVADWKRQTTELENRSDDGSIGKQVLAILEKIAAREKLPVSQFARTTVPRKLEEYLTRSQADSGRYDQLVRQAYIHPVTRSVFYNIAPRITLYSKERVQIEALLAQLVEGREQSPIALLNARRELARAERQLAEVASAKLEPMPEKLGDAAKRFDSIETQRATLKQELATLTGNQERMVDKLIAADTEIPHLRTDLLVAEADARLDLEAAKIQLCVATAAKIAQDRLAAAKKVRASKQGEFALPNEAYRAFSFHRGDAGLIAWDAPQIGKESQVRLGQSAVVEGITTREQLLDYVAKSETSVWAGILDRKLEISSDVQRAARK
jgi:hypothetical protein